MSRKSSFVSVLLAVALLGCPKRVGSQSETVDPETRAKIESAKKAAEEGRSEEAHQILVQVGNVEDPAVADALFAVGEAHFNAKEFDKARDTYRDLILRFPLFKDATTARYHLALSQLELKEYRDAFQTLGPLYEKLPDDEKPALATRLAQAAEGAQLWADAVRWQAEAMQRARDVPTQKAAEQRVFDLIEGKVPAIEIARLAQETPPSAAVWPLVEYKLARIYAHVRDAEGLRSAVEALEKNAPQSPYTAQAREMADRLARHGQSKPGVIGVVLPLSGKFERTGKFALDAINLALASGKDKDKVTLVVKDSAGDAAQARKAVTELAENDQVEAIIGPVLINETEDAVAEAELQEVPIITLSRVEGITEKGSWVFRNMLTSSAQANALVDYSMKHGAKTFAILYPNIPYGTELANYFWDAVEARGGEVRGAETYDHDQTTFKPVVQKLVGRYYLDEREEYTKALKEIREAGGDDRTKRKAVEKARDTLPPVIDFDALFIPDYYKNVGLIAPSLAVEDVITNACDKRDIERIAKTSGKDPKDIKTVQLLGGNGWNFQELVDRGQKFVNCSVFVDGFFVNSDRKETRAFVDAYRKAYNNRDPVLLDATAYDTTRLLRLLVEKENPPTRAAMRDALMRVKDFPGATGKTTINAKREAEKPLFLLTIDRGEIHEIDSDVKS